MNELNITMKRLFFILVAALMTVSMMAEKTTSPAIRDTIAHQTGKTGPNYDERNRVKSIAGVRFGETRRKAIGLFERRGTFVNNSISSIPSSNPKCRIFG